MTLLFFWLNYDDSRTFYFSFQKAGGYPINRIISQEINYMKINRKKKPYSSMYIGNTDPKMNIDFFNFHAGTFDRGDNGEVCAGCEASELTEAKRYVRRYYIKPQNIFCSNKAEIVLALIEHMDEDCTIYTLNNLGDVKDVSKLTDNDIIFYYEDQILYDKNHVRIMDYKLNIKNEEERQKIDVDKTSDARLSDIYDDRLTDLTELEEGKNPFNLTFPNLTEAVGGTCCICGEKYEGYGNNAEPYAHGKCCDACNIKFVIPARIAALHKEQAEEQAEE